VICSILYRSTAKGKENVKEVERRRKTKRNLDTAEAKAKGEKTVEALRTLAYQRVVIARKQTERAVADTEVEQYGVSRNPGPTILFQAVVAMVENGCSRVSFSQLRDRTLDKMVSQSIANDISSRPCDLFYIGKIGRDQLQVARQL
jgi:hypothetical protein